MKITLTANEMKLKSILLYVKDVEIRFAGGWVRDKLLNKQSNDIDVALEGMTGSDYVDKLRVELRLHHGSKMIKTMGKIAMNPDQSKHLETVTGSICGFDCDFVNLRSETYADHSRIPEMALGTPKEDALRRDFTINSLFYNLNKDSIEDFTGHGLEDLKSKIIRTPLDPMVTFMDDPLRALRAIRFASRFRYSIIPSILEACKSNKLQEALKKKVSNERIVIELDKTLKSKYFEYGFVLLYSTGLYDCIFKQDIQLPYKKDNKTQILAIRRINSNLVVKLGRLLQLNTTKQLINIANSPDKKLLLLSMLYAPYKGSLKELPNLNLFSSYFTTDALKFPKKDNQTAIVLLSKALEIKETFFDNQKTLDKKSFGIFLRENSVNNDFNTPLLYASLLYLSESFEYSFSLETLQFTDQLDQKTIEFINSTINNINLNIVQYQFTDIASWKTLLTGNDIMSLLNIKGPKVKEVLDLVMDYQIEHHPCTKEQVTEWIKQTYNAK